MNEYIISIPDTYINSNELPQHIRVNQLNLQEIVRCRDCKHYRKHKWFEVVVGVPLGTDVSDVCMLFADGCKVEPNGFCAWGEREVDA